MQKMMSVVIDVYKFGREIFTIDIFRNCIKCIFAALKDYKQPAQIKLLHPEENFVQQAEI